MKSTREIEFRRHCERSKPRVVWNSETRCFLCKSENDALRCNLFSTPVWPMEITRVTTSPSSRGKSKDPDVRMSIHGVAYMDLSSLVYPGNTQVFGAYPVVAFSESDISERTNCKYICSILESIFPKPFGNGETK